MLGMYFTDLALDGAVKVKVNIKLSLSSTMKAQKGSRVVDIFFL
jgi:hypothetical protein